MSCTQPRLKSSKTGLNFGKNLEWEAEIMGNILFLFTLMILGLAFPAPSFALSPSLFEKLSKEYLYSVPEFHEHFETFLNHGVPRPALIRTLDYFQKVSGKSFRVPARSGEFHSVFFGNEDSVVIVDYTRASHEKRLFVLNLITGEVQRHFVAHGLNSGGSLVYRTSNLRESRQTSLGFLVTGAAYQGQNGPSLKLYGLEKSNDQVFARTIVAHGANYVSLDYLKKYGRIGRSHGCVTLEKSVMKSLIPELKKGTLFYLYHEKLAERALETPASQTLFDINPPEDNPPPTAEEIDQILGAA